MTFRSKKNLLILIIAIPLIIAGVIWGYGPLQRFLPAGRPVAYPISDSIRNYGPEISQISVSGISLKDPPVFSEFGKLPRGFPQDLIVEKDVSFRQSWLQEHPEEHYTYLLVEYVSKQSLEQNKNYFSDYLAKQRWELVQNATTQADANEGRFDAVKGEDGVRIIMVQIPSGEIDIQISYRQHGRGAIGTKRGNKKKNIF